jgi:hypothetical protein
MDQIWEEAIDLATNALYRYNGIEWTVHEAVQIERGSQRARRSREAEQWYSTEEKTTSDEIPPTAVSTQTKREGRRYKAREPENQVEMDTGNNEPQSLQAYLKTWDKELHAKVQLLVEDEELEKLLRSQSKLVHCSDGGVTNGLGSFGWVLADEETGRILARSRAQLMGIRR